MVWRLQGGRGKGVAEEWIGWSGASCGKCCGSPLKNRASGGVGYTAVIQSTIGS